MGEHIAGVGPHNCQQHPATWTKTRKITGSKIASVQREKCGREWDSSYSVVTSGHPKKSASSQLCHSRHLEDIRGSPQRMGAIVGSLSDTTASYGPKRGHSCQLPRDVFFDAQSASESGLASSHRLYIFLSRPSLFPWPDAHYLSLQAEWTSLGNGLCGSESLGSLFPAKRTSSSLAGTVVFMAAWASVFPSTVP